MALESGELAYRLGRVEAKTDSLDETKVDKEVVEDIARRLGSLQRIIIGFMATVASSAVLVSFTLLITVGTHVH